MKWIHFHKFTTQEESNRELKRHRFDFEVKFNLAN